MKVKRCSQEKYFEFALWTVSLGRLPTSRETQAFFDISRPSAFKARRNMQSAIERARESKARRQPAFRIPD